MAQHFEAGPRRHTQVHGSSDRLAQVEHPTALHTGEMVVLGQVAVETAAAGVGPLDEQALVPGCFGARVPGAPRRRAGASQE